MFAVKYPVCLDIEGCYAGKCRNGGECEEDADNELGFTCTCPEPWTGLLCDVPGKTNIVKLHRPVYVPHGIFWIKYIWMKVMVIFSALIWDNKALKKISNTRPQYSFEVLIYANETDIIFCLMLVIAIPYVYNW